jgi:hypothetical protein
MVLMRQKMGCIYFGLFCHQTHLVTLFLGADFQPIMLTIKRLRQKKTRTGICSAIERSLQLVKYT